MQAGQIIAIILSWLIFEICSHLFLLEVFETIFYTPKSIYKETNMNWFGVIIVYILIFPFSFIFAIGGFLKWLFTVGRK